jgi:hypothetical protein
MVWFWCVHFFLCYQMADQKTFGWPSKWGYAAKFWTQSRIENRKCCAVDKPVYTYIFSSRCNTRAWVVGSMGRLLPPASWIEGQERPRIAKSMISGRGHKPIRCGLRRRPNVELMRSLHQWWRGTGGTGLRSSFLREWWSSIKRVSSREWGGGRLYIVHVPFPRRVSRKKKC